MLRGSPKALAFQPCVAGKPVVRFRVVVQTGAVPANGDKGPRRLSLSSCAAPVFARTDETCLRTFSPFLPFPVIQREILRRICPEMNGFADQFLAPLGTG